MKYLITLLCCCLLIKCTNSTNQDTLEKTDYLSATKNKWNEWYSNDKYIFGDNANDFFRSVIDTLPTGKALFPAEGEGRNAVYAAILDWEVDAFDLSESGQKKANQLALKNNTSINYFITDFSKPTLQPNSYDLIALVYSHVPEEVRKSGHKKLVEALKPGGLLIMEAFSEKHKNSGAKFGPKSLDMLYSPSEMREDFEDLNILKLEEVRVNLNEGFHQGEGEVIRIIARKGVLPKYTYPVAELAKRMESPNRERWQNPDAIIEKLGNINGKKVMDLGSGTGYFTFRLLEKGATVIAADPDVRFLDVLKKQQMEKAISKDKLIPRSIPYDNPNLAPEEIDVLFTVNTYQMIENRVDYLKKVYQGLKPNGELLIVTFKKRKTPNGPPVKFRITPKKVNAEIKAAGFKVIELDTSLLTENYIIKAIKN